MLNLHELTQPLTAIKGFAQLALASCCQESQCRDDLRRILEQVSRMERIIRSQQSSTIDPTSPGSKTAGPLSSGKEGNAGEGV